MGFISAVQGFVSIWESINEIHHIKKTEEWKPYDHLNTEEIFWGNSTTIYDLKKKNCQKSGHRGNLTQHNNGQISQTSYKHTDNIILNGEMLKAFPLKSGTRQGCPFLLLFST